MTRHTTWRASPSNTSTIEQEIPLQLKQTKHPPQSVVVIGGGVIGAFVAYHLARRGRKVTIIEKGGFGRGSSWGNCGIILPSHLLPLNSVENLVHGLRWTLKRDAPFYIRPRLDPALAFWLARFAVRCTPATRSRSATALAAVLDGAPDAFAEIIEREKIRCGWRRDGAIFLFQTAAGLSGRAAEEAETKRYGKGCTPLPVEALVETEAAAGPHAAGAWMDEEAAHLMPDALMSEMKRVLERLGVAVKENTAFFRFEAEKGRAASARTSAGRIDADAFVVATGAWTPLLSRALGVRLPIQPGKGYSVTLEGTDRPPVRPCFFGEAHSVVTPRPNGMRLGGTMEFSGYDDRLDPIRIEALFRAARRSLHAGHLGRRIEEWCGWRPMTVDGVPVIDRLPQMENVVVAAGHNMLGLSLAPVTGKMVSAMLLDETPPVDPAPYRLARFGRWVK